MDAPPGAAVALGPATATTGEVERAVAELDSLVMAGGAVAAGAGVDLGSGFRSARLAGARGDQRDAVLAALKVLGLGGADRLGDRAGFLVALFGPSVTKRVGAAAAQAIAEARWAAVQLASAASDVLGPEQLEHILALPAPSGVDLVSGGLPSALAGHLRQVLEPIPRPRRLELLVDLWGLVSAHHARLARRERLLATQTKQDRVGDLRIRRDRHEDDLLLQTLSADFAGDPSLADAARWIPPPYYWHGVLNRILQDALAATALLRVAVAVSDHGLDDGLARTTTILEAAAAELHKKAAKAAARRVPGLTGLPARPGNYVRDIHRRLLTTTTRGAKFTASVTQRLAHARDYALVIIYEVRSLLDRGLEVPAEILHDWAAHPLHAWRKKVGYTSVRPAAEWTAVSPWARELFGVSDTLADRLRGRQDAQVAEVEVVGDLLWFADLVDALAQLYGHDAATATPTRWPWLDHDPPMTPTEPLVPRFDSITLAVAGAAQLISLGAKPVKGVRTWAELTDGLRADIDIAAALNDDLSVPASLAAVDKTIVPGIGARFELARSGRTLAKWSDYMGNCIAGRYYVDAAVKGQCALAALYDEHDRILINAELRPLRPAERGWRVSEIAARFNNDPDAELEKRFRRWVADLPGAEPPETAPAAPDEVWPDRPGRRRAARRPLQTVGPALERLAGQSWTDQVTGEVIGPFAALAGTTPDAALTRLRRLGAGSLTNSCRRALDEGTVDLVELWAATGVRPLATAVQDLDQAVRDRFDQLALLTKDAPLPSSLRRLVRLPAVAPAYSFEVVARRVRTAIGQLAYDDDPVIARAVTRRADSPLLCALVIAINCRAPAIDLTQVAPPRTTTVPGFPVTCLDDPDGPWQQALPAARQLGADTGALWDQMAEQGLRIPRSWLGAGGWTALWSRAHQTH